MVKRKAARKRAVVRTRGESFRCLTRELAMGSLPLSVIEIYTTAMDSFGKVSAKRDIGDRPVKKAYIQKEATKEPEELLHELQHAKLQINQLSNERKILAAKITMLQKGNYTLERKKEEMMISQSLGNATRSLGGTIAKFKADDNSTVGLKNANKIQETKIKSLESELQLLKKSLRFTKLVESEVEVKTYYQEVHFVTFTLMQALRLTRILEHDSIGTTMISGDGEHLLRYDELLEDIKIANTETLKRLKAAEELIEESKSKHEASERKNSTLQNQVAQVKLYYEQLVEHCKAREKEHCELIQMRDKAESDKAVFERTILGHQSEIETMEAITREIRTEKVMDLEQTKEILNKANEFAVMLDHLTSQLELVKREKEETKAALVRETNVLAEDKKQFESTIHRYKLQQEVIQEESNQYRLSFQRSNKLNLELNKQMRVVQKELATSSRRLHTQQHIRTAASVDIDHSSSMSTGGTSRDEGALDCTDGSTNGTGTESRVTFSDDDNEIYKATNIAREHPRDKVLSESDSLQTIESSSVDSHARTRALKAKSPRPDSENAPIQSKDCGDSQPTKSMTRGTISTIVAANEMIKIQAQVDTHDEPLIQIFRAEMKKSGSCAMEIPGSTPAISNECISLVGVQGNPSVFVGPTNEHSEDGSKSTSELKPNNRCKKINAIANQVSKQDMPTLPPLVQSNYIKEPQKPREIPLQSNAEHIIDPPVPATALERIEPFRFNRSRQSSVASDNGTRVFADSVFPQDFTPPTRQSHSRQHSVSMPPIAEAQHSRSQSENSSPLLAAVVSTKSSSSSLNKGVGNPTGNISALKSVALPRSASVPRSLSGTGKSQSATSLVSKSAASTRSNSASKILDPIEKQSSNSLFYTTGKRESGLIKATSRSSIHSAGKVTGAVKTSKVSNSESASSSTPARAFTIPKTISKIVISKSNSSLGQVERTRPNISSNSNATITSTCSTNDTSSPIVSVVRRD